MTHDKIVHYLGKEQTNFICMQTVDKLEDMKKQLLYEFNEVHPKNPIPAAILFQYTIEMELINRLLSPIN
jgi:hypothetical protein